LAFSFERRTSDGHHAQKTVRITGVIVIDVRALKISVADINQVAVGRARDVCRIPSIERKRIPKVWSSPYASLIRGSLSAQNTASSSSLLYKLARAMAYTALH